MALGRIGGIDQGGHDFDKFVVLHRIFGDQRHVIGCGVTVLAVKTARIGKVGVFCADLPRFFVHHLAEPLDTAVPYKVGNHHGRLVCRLEHHCIEQVAHLQFFVEIDAAEGIHLEVIKLVLDVGF